MSIGDRSRFGRRLNLDLDLELDRPLAVIQGDGLTLGSFREGKGCISYLRNPVFYVVEPQLILTILKPLENNSCRTVCVAP
ncbi:hypothetical protein D3C87_1553460 [compost metagenome]